MARLVYLVNIVLLEMVAELRDGLSNFVSKYNTIAEL